MSSDTHASKQQTYYMPSDSVSADEWSEFDNVYQVHCPRIFMNNAIRDVRSHLLLSLLAKLQRYQILTQYYLCSRAWRGLEYHMATRLVKLEFNVDVPAYGVSVLSNLFEIKRRLLWPQLRMMIVQSL